MSKNYKLIKERPVGTIFQWHKGKLQVVEDNNELGGCFACVFKSRCMKVTADKSCASDYRSDGKDIHYKLLKLCQK